MAPRPPETKEQVLERLRAAAAEGRNETRFGSPHHTHAACHEQGVWRVRRLALSPEKANRYRETHGIFMPEHAEALSEPGGVIFEAGTLELLCQELARRWPL